MRRALAVLVVLVLYGCSDGGKQRPKTHRTSHGGRAEPKHERHASHEHSHGAHPHDENDHHHHPHPHPHLDGVNGHHHPY